MKLIVGAGGTGGHIIPALAVAKELISRGWKITFIGNKDSMEQTVIKQNNIEFLPINVQKLYRKITIQHLWFPVLLLSSLLRSLRYIKKNNPDAVLCTGGFVSGPVALASVILGKKLYIQDGNSYPGLTTRLMANYANRTFISSITAMQYLKSADCLVTGNPIMKYSLLNIETIDWNWYNLSRGTKKLLVIGGSQGSTIINHVVEEIVSRLLDLKIEIIWQTGTLHIKNIKTEFGAFHGVHCFDFTDHMNDYYQMADLAISRAGALSIAELEEHRLPSIFIPLPKSAENHQFKNAVEQVTKGGGILLEQSRLTPETLLNSISEIIEKYDYFKGKLNALPHNTASQVISDLIERETNYNREMIC